MDKLCECGCGLFVTKPSNRFIFGHRNRGWHPSQETIRKSRLAHTGIHPSEATKLKNSLANKGKVPWNKGKHLTPEHIKKAALGHIGIHLSEEHRKKISVANTGKQFSDEHKKNLSIARKLRITTTETKARCTNHMLKVWGSMSPQRKQDILDKSLNKHDVRLGRASKPQNALYNFIKNVFPSAAIEFKVIINFNHYVYLDIALTEDRINFEYDEPYWHKNIERDIKRDNILQELGWIIIRIKGKRKLKSFISKIPLDNFVNQLRGIDRSNPDNSKNGKTLSCSDAIAKVLDEYLPEETK